MIAQFKAENSHKHLLRILLFFLPLVIVGRVELLIDQSVVSQIAGGYLTAICLIAQLTVAFRVVTLIMARATYVLISKTADPESRERLMGGALALSVFVSVAIALAMFVACPFLLKWLGIADLTGISTAFHLTILGAMISSCVVVLRYGLMAEKAYKTILAIDVPILVLTILFKYACLYFKGQPAYCLNLVMSATVIGQLALAVSFCYQTRKRLSFSILASEPIKRCHQFLARAKVMLLGELYTSVLISFEPLLVIGLMKASGQVNLIAPYSIGANLYGFISTPLTALMFGGITRLGACWNQRQSRVWDRRVKTIRELAWVSCGLPAMVLALATPLWLPKVFGLHDWSSIAIAGAMVLAIVPMAESTKAWCEVLVFEKVAYVANVNLTCLYVLGLPLVAASLSFHIPWVFALFGVLLPRVFRELGIHLLARRWQSLRRIEPRRLVTDDIRIRFCSVADNNTLTAKLYDLSQGGCGLLTQNHSGLKPGDEIEIELSTGDRSFVWQGRGIVRNLRTSLIVSKSQKTQWRIGVQFLPQAGSQSRAFESILSQSRKAA